MGYRIAFNQITPEMIEEQRQKSKNPKLNIINDEFDRRPVYSQIQYDPDMIPPQFEVAKMHKKATLVGKDILAQKIIGSQQEINEDGTAVDIEVDEEICPCCTRKTQRQQLDLNCNLQDLAYIGPGYPLYFYYIKFCAILFLVLLAAGGYNIYTNFNGETCIEQSKIVEKKLQCRLDWVTMLSIGNKLSQKDQIDFQSFLNIITIGLLILFFQYFRKKIRTIDVQCDIADVSAIDYTIYIKNIPLKFKARNNDYDEDLMYFFEEKVFMGDPKYEIQSVNLTYDMTEVKILQKKKMKLLKEKANIVWHQHKKGFYEPGRTIGQINIEINEIQKQIDHLQKKFADGKDPKFMEKYFYGQALISFQNPSVKDEIVERFCPTGGWFEKKQKITYQGNLLQILPAPDPLNIFWDNLGFKNQIPRQTLTFFVVVFTFSTGAFFAVYFYIKELQTILNDINSTILEFLFTFIVSVLISGLNMLVLIIGKYISLWEKHHTQTEYNISAIKKIAFAQFLVTVCVIFLVELVINPDNNKNISNFQRTFSNGGLIYKVNTVIIGNVIFPFLAELFDVKQILKKLKQYRIEKKAESDQPILKTQDKLNKIFENIDFNIIKRYTIILKTMYLVAFYSTILPLGILWGLLSLLLTYWVDKYNLLRRRSVLFNMDSSLATEMVEMLEFVLIIYALGNYASMVYIIDEDSISDYLNLSTLGLAVSIVHAALPMQWINERFFSNIENPPNISNYDAVKTTFITDYARENPATSKVSKQNHLKLISEMKKEILKKNQQHKFTMIQKQNLSRLSKITNKQFNLDTSSNQKSSQRQLDKMEDFNNFNEQNSSD